MPSAHASAYRWKYMLLVLFNNKEHWYWEIYVNAIASSSVLCVNSHKPCCYSSQQCWGTAVTFRYITSKKSWWCISKYQRFLVPHLTQPQCELNPVFLKAPPKRDVCMSSALCELAASSGLQSVQASVCSRGAEKEARFSCLVLPHQFCVLTCRKVTVRECDTHMVGVCIPDL